MENYVGTKRRVKAAGNIVYDVLDQTGLNTAIPSDPLDNIVVLGFKPGRGVDETVIPFLTMTVRVMLAETTAWRSPVAVDTNDNGMTLVMSFEQTSDNQEDFADLMAGDGTKIVLNFEHEQRQHDNPPPFQK